MRHSFLCLLVVVGLVSCGSDKDDPSPSPTAPSPSPVPAPTRAFFVPVGGFAFTECTATADPFCTFVAQLENRGTGCAEALRGTVRFFSASGIQLSLPLSWNLPPNQIVLGNAVVTYRVHFVPVNVAQLVADYIVVPQWTDVSCTPSLNR